jgi:secondary thiamine-phosphate synthase enzyme
MHELTIKSSKRNQFIDVTSKIHEIIDKSKVKKGICFLFVPHTTAAITINEGADPDVSTDIQRKLSQLIPANNNYMHSEGNSDSHIKSSLIGCSEMILIEKEKLVLGTWQKIFFCEFDGPRTRKILIQFLK